MEDLNEFEQFVDISVEGMGLLVNSDAQLLEKLLRDAGYVVQVNNEHPEDDEFWRRNLSGNGKRIVTDEEIQKRREDVAEHHLSRISKTKITLNVKHRPWGG